MKRLGGFSTTLIAKRRLVIGMERVSIPFQRILPPYPSFKRDNRRRVVDFPWPFNPAIAVIFPGLAAKERERRISGPSCVYLKETFSNSIVAGERFKSRSDDSTCLNGVVWSLRSSFRGVNVGSSRKDFTRSLAAKARDRAPKLELSWLNPRPTIPESIANEASSPPEIAPLRTILPPYKTTVISEEFSERLSPPMKIPSAAAAFLEPKCSLWSFASNAASSRSSFPYNFTVRKCATLSAALSTAASMRVLCSLAKALDHFAIAIAPVPIRGSIERETKVSWGEMRNKRMVPPTEELRPR
mmetsp:Transcript_14744/g.26405  ORF Transcript_14744/g.26405 Transcript_14744/m.26405 type:complete len:300 (+) Transcript_14744:520-1419(+)